MGNFLKYGTQFGLSIIFSKEDLVNVFKSFSNAAK